MIADTTPTVSALADETGAICPSRVAVGGYAAVVTGRAVEDHQLLPHLLRQARGQPPSNWFTAPTASASGNFCTYNWPSLLTTANSSVQACKYKRIDTASRDLARHQKRRNSDGRGRSGSWTTGACRSGGPGPVTRGPRVTPGAASLASPT